ncbi:Protein NLRC5 [Symbiodinium microadriaticum]|uniref:Protein NLRC5 n=1 Tax=Symbiodinium microadriaticum TaxID=2951 RepID=A0A1Q9EK07_SYMMI|nr:Protein NLRC5 [Symbiodinium microadriaticum]
MSGDRMQRFADRSRADQARALAAGLGQQKELERLELNLNGEEGAKAVASALARLTELKELTLSMEPGEKIGDAGAAAVAESLRNLRQLTDLRVDLRSNAFGEEGAKAVASALARLTELKELSLGLVKNQIGDAGAAAVAESLRNLRQLTVLKVYLRSNALGDAGATAVVESLRELPQLTEVVVQLENNDLGKEEKEKLRAIFAALPVRQKGLSLGALAVGFLPSAADLPPKKQRSRGGSMPAVGSVAGVTLMGLEGVGFLWYAKRISPWAALGFVLGLGTFALPQAIFA